MRKREKEEGREVGEGEETEEIKADRGWREIGEIEEDRKGEETYPKGLLKSTAYTTFVCPSRERSSLPEKVSQTLQVLS